MKRSKMTTTSKIKDRGYIMKLTTKGLGVVVAVLIPLLSLAGWVGSLKTEVASQDIKIVKLEAVVAQRDVELKAELDKKVDLSVFNITSENVEKQMAALEKQNTTDHKRMEKSIEDGFNKLDKTLEKIGR